MNASLAEENSLDSGANDQMSWQAIFGAKLF
jgi:hypothetical protein